MSEEIKIQQSKAWGQNQKIIEDSIPDPNKNDKILTTQKKKIRPRQPTGNKNRRGNMKFRHETDMLRSI